MSTISARALSSMPSNNNSMKEVIRRLMITIFAVIVYRIGTYIPIPGIDPSIVSNIADKHNEGVLGMLNVFSGGALGRMTIFSLNVMPYITSSIIMQLLVFSYSPLSDLKKSGASGQKKINQYTKYLTLIFASFQAYGISTGLVNMEGLGSNLVIIDKFLFKIIAIFSLVSSTIFLIWLGEHITSKGIGNGISILIFVGIVSEFPSVVGKIISLAKMGTIPLYLLFLFIAILIGLLALIVFAEKSYRKIAVQYPKRQVNKKYMSAATTSFLPLRINTAGVIPPIFASSILLFPVTLFSFQSPDKLSTIGQFFLANMVNGKPLFIIAFTILIFFFCFFYTAIVFSSKDTADNLKLNGGYILGIRPGNETAKYLDRVLSRITFVGASYMVFVAVLPELFFSKFSLPFYLGGTSLLIIVNVSIDTLTQFQTYLLSDKYKKAFKKKHKKV